MLEEPLAWTCIYVHTYLNMNTHTHYTQQVINLFLYSIFYITIYLYIMQIFPHMVEGTLKMCPGYLEIQRWPWIQQKAKTSCCQHKGNILGCHSHSGLSVFWVPCTDARHWQGTGFPAQRFPGQSPLWRCSLHLLTDGQEVSPNALESTQGLQGISFLLNILAIKKKTALHIGRP